MMFMPAAGQEVMVTMPMSGRKRRAKVVSSDGVSNVVQVQLWRDKEQRWTYGQRAMHITHMELL